MTTRADQIAFCEQEAKHSESLAGSVPSGWQDINAHRAKTFRAIAETLRSSTPAPLASPDAGTTSGGHPSVPNGEDSGRKRRQNIDAMPELTRYPYDHPKVLYRTVCLASEVDAMVATLRADREAAPAPPEDDHDVGMARGIAAILRTHGDMTGLNYVSVAQLIERLCDRAAARPGVAVAPKEQT